MSELGNKQVFAKNLQRYMNKENIDRYKLCKDLNFKYSTVSEWLAAKKYPRIDKIEILANYFHILKSDLIEESKTANNSDYIKLPAPTITEDYTEIPVIGEIAAGFNHIAYESWEGETVPIPNHYLKGHNHSEYFILNVKGSSMYPLYQDGDQVLVLKQSTLNHSGQIGAILYNDECATLKKVEYVMGEDWMKLIPINPNFEPELIEDEDLEHCRVIGIPRLLIREIND